MRVKVVGVVAELAMTGSETRVASSALPSAAVPEQGAPTVTRGGAQASLLEGALGTEGFTAGAVEIFGYMGHDLRALLKRVAEASTYSSVMDLGLSPAQQDAVHGFLINEYHSYIAVAVQKGVSRALRLMALGLGAQLPSHSEVIKIRRQSVIRSDRCFG